MITAPIHDSDPVPASPKVFIVDDDDAIRLSLRMLLEANGLAVEDFAGAEEFLAICTPQYNGCLITDLRMPKFDGLQLQATLAQRGIEMPVIMLTGHADVPAAVESLKAGAIDFIEKPFDPLALLQLVRKAMAMDAERLARAVVRRKQLTQLERLTPRELEVAERVSAGQSNKVIAIELGISDRTVELHRSRAMKKLQVRTVPDLVRLLSDLSAADLLPADN